MEESIFKRVPCESVCVTAGCRGWAQISRTNPHGVEIIRDFDARAAPFRRGSEFVERWWGSTTGVRRVQRVGCPGRGIDRRIERDRRKERRKGREQRVRKGWRGERPLGSRTAIETHRLTCVLGIFFSVPLAFFRCPPLPAPPRRRPFLPRGPWSFPKNS